MSASIVAPLIVAMALSVIVTAVHRRLPPVLAARTVFVTVVVVVGAAVPTVLTISLGYLAHVPILGISLQWCANALGVHQRIPTWIGAPSVLVAVGGTIRTWRVLHDHRRIRHDHIGGVEIAGHDTPFAFTLPGRGGHIVLSSGLIELLDDREQAVVLAHEKAHARYRHDRYLLTAQVAAACLPLLRPLVARLQFSLERWADEAAVETCGDRRFVAHTLGKVALQRSVPVGALAFSGLGVPARVAALLGPAVPVPGSAVTVGLWSAIGATGAIAVFQIHHLATLIAAVCPG